MGDSLSSWVSWSYRSSLCSVLAPEILRRWFWLSHFLPWPTRFPKKWPKKNEENFYPSLPGPLNLMKQNSTPAHEILGRKWVSTPAHEIRAEKRGSTPAHEIRRFHPQPTRFSPSPWKYESFQIVLQHAVFALTSSDRLMASIFKLLARTLSAKMVYKSFFGHFCLYHNSATA